MSSWSTTAAQLQYHHESFLDKMISGEARLLAYHIDCSCGYFLGTIDKKSIMVVLFRFYDKTTSKKCLIRTGSPSGALPVSLATCHMHSHYGWLVGPTWTCHCLFRIRKESFLQEAQNICWSIRDGMVTMRRLLCPCNTTRESFRKIFVL
jgi:hypothetical protein